MSRFLWPITEGSVHFRLFSKRETLKEGPLKLEDIVMEHRREENRSKATGRKPLLIPVTKLEDGQVIRTAEFHPSGRLYASGANSKSLRICAYPKLNEVSEKCETRKPTILIEKMKHHKGSIYCLAWNGTGDLLATGSNDKTIKLMRFNPRSCNIEGGAMELTMHMGTVRDLCFMEDLSNQSSLLISGGSIDNKIFITDCETGVAFQTLTGHSGTVLSLYTWGGATFVSGSHDRTIRFWDLRSRGCVNVISAPRASGFGPA
ncbi:WD repeat-containing protein 47-like [Tachypleus tridentatus]|uniref:WD repeat-containing protein 47-like n=1 Tax=Tachypleus tridentatus TaxID=6853 RepID=UPI003FD2AA61